MYKTISPQGTPRQFVQTMSFKHSKTVTIKTAVIFDTRVIKVTFYVISIVWQVWQAIQYYLICGSVPDITFNDVLDVMSTCFSVFILVILVSTNFNASVNN